MLHYLRVSISKTKPVIGSIYQSFPEASYIKSKVRKTWLFCQDILLITDVQNIVIEQNAKPRTIKLFTGKYGINYVWPGVGNFFLESTPRLNTQNETMGKLDFITLRDFYPLEDT